MPTSQPITRQVVTVSAGTIFGIILFVVKPIVSGGSVLVFNLVYGILKYGLFFVMYTASFAFFIGIGLTSAVFISLVLMSMKKIVSNFSF